MHGQARASFGQGRGGQRLHQFALAAAIEFLSQRRTQQIVKVTPEEAGCQRVRVDNASRPERDKQNRITGGFHQNTEAGVIFALLFVVLFQRDLRLHQLLLHLGDRAQIATQKKN